MTEKSEPEFVIQWWWHVTKSERAARLVEAYWKNSEGNRAIVLMDEHKDGPRSLAKRQVRTLKQALFRMGYRLFWRVHNGKIIGWVAPDTRPVAPGGQKVPTLVKPPFADQPKKRKRVDKPAILPPDA